MKRIPVLLCVLAMVTLYGGCTAEKSANNNTAPNSGAVETNANVNQNLNANTAPSNVGVLTNDNGNQNTAGVRTINGNANSNQNSKRKTGNGNN